MLACAPDARAQAMLPQDHPYQRDLRKFLATLTEADLAVVEKPFLLAPAQRSPDDQYRAHLLLINVPPFHAIKLPASQFLLASIEGGKDVMQPPTYIDALAWLASWDDPGNPYFQSRPVRLRAFVAATVDMLMHDHLNETRPDVRTSKSDCLGGTLIWLAMAYDASRNMLPPEVRVAYETGLKKIARRIDGWGPTGAMVDMDLFAAVSLHMVAGLVNDPETTALAEKYFNRLFTDPRYSHPAGYFVDNDCFDTSYNGISLYFAAWAAMRAPDWPAARKAVDQAFKLRSRLSFPDPDGNFYGPTQCSSRTSADSPHDQWNFPTRNLGAAMLSDHAIYLNPLPTPDTLAAAPKKLTDALNELVATAKPAPNAPWQEDHWIASGAINFPYTHYVKGHYDRLAKLKAENSPLLKPPFLRDETFVEAYDKAFVVARFADYGFAIHSGPVGDGMHGFGGGQLCGFWTPTAGTVVLGRRRGIAAQVKGHTSSDEPGVASIPDTFESWRIWPVHAVTGVTARGNVFTSARLRDCQPVYSISGKRAEVKVGGVIPRDATNDGPCLTGDVRYSRAFTADEKGLAVETTISGDGKDSVVELCESIPIYLRDTREQSRQKPATISFQIGDEWKEATTEPHRVRAVMVRRFDGAVRITFEKPMLVRLSPEEWLDKYQTKANCRTILIDLLENDGKPVTLTAKKKVSYRIQTVKD